MNQREKNDERFADPQADADPRTSDGGRTSAGACGLDADAATAPADAPGVRSGDEDSPAPPSTPSSINPDKAFDILSQT